MKQDHNSQPRIKRPPLPGDHLTSEATLLFTMFGFSICFTRRTKTVPFDKDRYELSLI